MKSRLIPRVLALAAALLLASGSASAYYYYIQFDANGKAVPWKWDLTTLSNNTVYFYVADSGLDTQDMLPGDGYETLVSELRAAADVWNSVPGSAIRIGYGGLFHGADNNAGINVEFSSDVPPGLLAYSLVTSQGTRLTPTLTPTGAAFLPITTSKLVFPALPYGLNGPGVPLATWSELFFTTAVHEFGHNLGLQHATTSAAMSTYITSGVSKARPLGADDIAGISALYPVTSTLTPEFGSITGKVTLTDGSPVNLAAVVAIPAAGDAVGAMTLPDGTYEIDGIPPGFYYVYAQSLPPAESGETSNLGLIYPLAADGVTATAPGPADCTTNPATAQDCYFETTFYPNTSSWRAAGEVQVSAGVARSGINMQVAPRNFMLVSGVRSYGYVPGGTVVESPPILKGGPRQTLIIAAPGNILDANNQFEPGIAFDALGFIFQVVPNSARQYPAPNPNGYVAVDVTASYFGANGARHFIIQSADNVYVLPAAVLAVSGAPPTVASVQALPDGTVAVNGSNLSSQTRIVFDGAAGAILNTVSSHQVIVSPPPASPGFVSHVEALGTDGQSSLFISGDTGVQTYTWPGSGAPALSVTSGTLPAGGSMTVDVVGTNTDFVQGQTFVGFGTSDALVTNVTVLDTGHLQVTVTAAAGTSIPTTNINVTTGLSVISQNLGNSVTGM
jgi:hypothetical protein